MIVNQIEDGWEIIFQPAHGLLAAQIAEKLDPSFFLEGYRIETIAAIQDHDDHQADFEKTNYVTKIGAPQDFTLAISNASEKLKQVKKVTQGGFHKSSWVGVLISYHCDFLYKKGEVSKKLKALLKTLKKKRNKILKDNDLTQKDLKASYDLLRFCDRSSLILTRKNIPEMNRKVEVITFNNGVKYELWKSESGNINVDPWPFEKKKFTVKVESVIVSKLYFKNDKELKKELKKGKTKVHKWCFAKA